MSNTIENYEDWRKWDRKVTHCWMVYTCRFDSRFSILLCLFDVCCSLDPNESFNAILFEYSFIIFWGFLIFWHLIIWIVINTFWWRETSHSQYIFCSFYKYTLLILYFKLFFVFVSLVRWLRCLSRLSLMKFTQIWGTNSF